MLKVTGWKKEMICVLLRNQLRMKNFPEGKEII